MVFARALNRFKNELQLLRRFYTYVKPYRGAFMLAMLTTMPLGAIDGVIAYSLKIFIDTFQSEKSMEAVNGVPFLIAGFSLLYGAVYYLSEYLNGKVGSQILCGLRRAMFTSLQRMDLGFFDRNTTGNVLARYFHDPQNVYKNLINATRQLMMRLSSALFLCVTLILTAWQLAAVAIGILFLILYPVSLVRNTVRRFSQDSLNANSEFMTFFNDTVTGIQLIHSYNLAPFRQSQFEKKQRYLYDRTMKQAKITGWLKPVMHLIAAAGIGLVIWLGGMMVQEDMITTGSFVAFVAAMMMLYNPVKNLGNLFINLHTAIHALERVIETVDSRPAVQDRPDAVVLDAIRQDIVFDDVSFSYRRKNQRKKAIRHVDTVFRVGEKVALVGPSGGGKSTLIKLILRFYDVDKGRILVDGRDIRDLAQASLRRHISLVTQDNYLFQGTIRDNLLLGDPEATDEDLWAALEKACLADTIRERPDGLDAEIGDRGMQLSGGQRQRLAIARAFLKDAAVLILDEATSALDNESETLVYRAMETLMEGRTVIIIAHRLATVRNVDRILVIDGGRVVEAGRHETLLAGKGVYASLYNAQFEGLTAEPGMAVS